MAAKLLSSSSSPPTPQLLCSFSLHSKLKFKDSTQQQSWLRQAPNPPSSPTTRAKKKQLAVAVAVQEPLLASTSALIEHINNLDQNRQSLYLLAESTAGYSLASYYTSLGLFVISVPGLWSLIKRSVKSKIVQKTFVGEGESKKAPNQVAGEIFSFFTRNNFVVTDRGEVITHDGSKSRPSSIPHILHLHQLGKCCSCSYHNLS